MITGFEEYTQPLTDYETTVIVPRVVMLISGRKGAEQAINNATLRSELERRFSEKVSDSKLRALINHIRTNHIVEYLLASSKGYYIATSVEEVENYCRSLAQRECAIKSVRLSLMDGIDGKLWI